jgi:drug/metabolite transporter (DMT)-like permease
MIAALKKYLPIFLAVTFWALSFVWVKMAYESFTPIGLVTLRVAGASLIFVLIAFIMYKGIEPIKRGDLKYFLLMSFLEPFLYFMGESHGLMLVSSTLGSVIISTIPLFTPFAAWLIIKEKVTAPLILGLLVSLMGILLMLLNSSGNIEASTKGILLMFLAVASAVFFPAILKKLASSYRSITILAYQNIFGLILFLPVFFITDYDATISATYTKASILAWLGLTLFASVLAFVFYINSIKTLGVSRSNAFINLIPVITAIFSFILLSEPIGKYQIAGIGFVISGLFVSQLKIRRHRAGKN